jgi:hypothetical protein
MALELIDRTPVPEAGGYRSVSVQFSLRKGAVFLNGGLDLPGKFATVSDSEILEEIKRQLAVQMYEGDATPALITEYANLTRQMIILGNGSVEHKAREKALHKLVNKVNKGNDKLLMTLLLNVLDANTINDNRDIIIDAFDSYEVGVDYSVGDKFKYDNRLFEVLEEHTSVEVWKPTGEPTKYKEIILTREETDKKEDLEDEAGRYITKAQLNDAMAGVFQAVMKAVEEMFEEEEGGEENGNSEHASNGVSHSEGGIESNETK